MTRSQANIDTELYLLHNGCDVTTWKQPKCPCRICGFDKVRHQTCMSCGNKRTLSEGQSTLPAILASLTVAGLIFLACDQGGRAVATMLFGRGW